MLKYVYDFTPLLMILSVGLYIIDIMVRKGVHENTVYHIKEAQKLKQEFDEMLGFNLYSLCPEILYN